MIHEGTDCLSIYLSLSSLRSTEQILSSKYFQLPTRYLHVILGLKGYITFWGIDRLNGQGNGCSNIKPSNSWIDVTSFHCQTTHYSNSRWCDVQQQVVAVVIETNQTYHQSYYLSTYRLQIPARINQLIHDPLSIQYRGSQFKFVFKCKYLPGVFQNILMGPEQKRLRHGHYGLGGGE